MKHNYFKSNQCEEMARNLWVYLYTQMGVKSAKSMSAGSEAEGRKTDGRASNEHPLSIHSASIEHPLQGRGKAVKMPLHFLRYAAMIFAVLVMSVANIGMAWGAEEKIVDLSVTTSSSNPLYTIASDDNWGTGDKKITVTVSGTRGQKNTTYSCYSSSKSYYPSFGSSCVMTFALPSSGNYYITKVVLNLINNSTSNVANAAGYEFQNSSGTAFTGANDKGSLTAQKYDGCSDVTLTPTTTEAKKFVIGRGVNSVSGSEGRLAHIEIWVEEASTGRYYDGTEKLYFLRDAFSWWKNDEVVFYAYFWNATTNAWSEAAAWQVQTTSENKDVWAYTVPEGTWTGVQLTRHPKGTTTPTIGNRTNYSTDITIDPNKNLITDWTVYNGGDNDGHSNTWSNITIDNKKVYFDNRNYSTWTTAYVRMGHSTYNSAWGPMTKVAGTKYLYEKETDQWDFHTDFTIADSYGWTNGNNIYQPWENQSWSAPAKITKQTNYQKYGVARDYYLCPTSTSMLERECQYYNVNGTTFTTTTIDNTSTGTLLPQYEVTSSGTKCTVTMVKYTADDFSTSSALASGGTVMPTQYIGVTVSPTTGYKFSSVSLTTGKYEQHTAAAAGVTGKYAILGNCEVSATCVAKTCTIVFDKEGGSGTISNVTATYGSAMPSKAENLPTKDGYTFDGFWDGDNGTGTQYYKADGTSKRNWDKDTESNTTLYAKWNCVTPDAPAAAKITATDGCAGSAGATFSANDSGKPSYVTWYWQTASDGTSTSYPVSSDYETASTAGSKTMYVRAKNTACDTWSTATSKSATVKTAATISWNTAPADGTAGGSMTASVTTNYSDGVAYAVTSASPAGCVTIHETSGAISYVAAGTATITATVTGAGDYCGSANVSKSITVTAAATPIITWEMKLTSGQNWGLNGDPSTTDETNITSISANNTHAAQLDGKTANGTMTAGCTTAQNGTARDNNIYVEFKFHVGCDKKLTPSKISLQVSNIGGSSDGNMTYDAILTDGTRTVSGSVTPASDGTLTTLEFTNADASKYMQGDVTLRVYPYNNNGGNTGSGFRMGQYVKIFGEIANQATPAATITWNTQPANGQVGDPDFAYDVTCSDGSAVTVTSANTTYATIVGGKLHYAAAGTTHLVATATDACGNTVTPVNSNDFTVTVPVTYSITYDCDGAESGCPSNVAAATNLPNPLPSAPTKDGYDFVGWYTNSTKTVAAVAGAALSENTTLYAKWTVHSASECITITNFATSNTSCSNNIPDNNSKYFYGYKGTVDDAHAVTITSNDGNDRGQNSGVEMRLTYNKKMRIYANNTTNATPAGFENVVSVSFKWKFIASGNSGNTELTSSYTVKVGSTTIANAVSITGKTNDGYATVTIDNLAQLNGYIEFLFGGSSSSYNVYLDDIEICTADMASCTTPTLPTATLNDQALCEGADIATWTATPTNASTITGKGESISYSWKKKGSETVLGTDATFDLGNSATESQAGTYVVTVTVSKAGYTSATVSEEIELGVTESTEVTSITADKATVYEGNSVTLTATANTTVSWQWYTCTNAAGDGESSIGGATSAAYAIASAGDAGTYYYKAKATGSCGTGSMVYTLTVSAAAGGDCETEIWVVKAADLPEGATAATHITTPFTGGSNESASITIDGNTYTITQRTSNATGPATIVVPEGNTATLYILVKGNNGRSVILEKGGVEQWTETPENGWQALSVDNLAAGTYSLRSSNNLGWGLLALKLCSASACTDPEVTASADNTTACVGTSVTFTATGAHAEATYQWQKLDGTWTNISGATASTYNIPSVVAGNAGKYRVIASHNCNRTSNEVTLSVPSAPDFGSTVPASVSVMQTIALSITTVEASDAASYKWYKSANSTWDAGDAEIGSSKELMKAYADEAIGSPSYYVFCRATNSCATTTSSAIAINVTAYVDADCAIAGSSGEHNTFSKTGSVSSGTYGSVTELHTNSNNKYLQYVAEEGYYFKTAKVNACVSDASSLPTAAYSYSTDGGANWTDAALPTAMTTAYADHVIDPLPANVNAFRVGRKLGDYGSGSGTLYIHEVCFEYSESCTSTTVTASPTSKTHTIGDLFTKPTFTVKHGETTFDPQPSLTYTSSNEDIATVDDDGTVNFQGMTGTVTITASFAGGTISATEYCASSGSYTITVSCSSERPKIVPGGTVNMSGCNPSVALNAKMQDGTSDFSPAGTYQWYRDGEAISGATSASYTARQAGIYTVERTYDGCTNVSSNNATITSERVEPEVERLVPFQYYHVDSIYHETSIMRYRHLFTVKASEEYNSTGRNFKMELSKNGSTPEDKTTSNAFVVKKSADNTVDTVLIDLNKLSGKFAEGDELIFTCKAVDCAHNVSEVYKDSITMHVIDKTPTMALILAGKDGGALNEYEPKNLQKQTGEKTWSGEWPLYTEMKKQYIITPLNGYAPFNKLNYEQYDIIFLTDFPKKSKNATAINNLADLCDYRPLFTFKTHMSGLSKWATKGFTEDPEVPKQSRLRLNIVCYAHPMFEELQTPSVKNQMLRDADDNTQLVYTLLKEGGYEKYGDVKKGIQGFDFTASDNFVTIGLIHYDATAEDSVPDNEHVTWRPSSADKTLVAAAERQYNPEARMVMFSLNAGAHSKLTETGQNVVLACLEYLLQDVMITPMADCAYTFDNDEGRGNGKWSVATNWLQEEVPGPYQSVRIIAPTTVDCTDAKALEVRLVDNGKITIAKNGVLTVQSTIRRKDGSETLPTEEDDIVIETAADGQGALIFNNDRGDSRATVNLYSKGRKDGNNYQFQYIAMPMGRVPVHPYFEGSDIFTYAYTEAGGWERRGYYTDLYAFEGIGVTTRRATASSYTIKGALTSTEAQTLDMTYENPEAGDKGYNMFGNSWSAPIQISQLRVGNEDANIQKTVYIYVAGKDPDGGPTTSGDKTEVAGKWLAIPFDASGFEGWTGLKVIPAFQAFEIQTNAAATLSLDYDKMVRGGTTDRNAALRGPQRRSADHEGIELMVLHLNGGKVSNDLFLFEGDRFSEAFDNGWEATYKEDEEIPTQLYSPTVAGKMAVAALPTLEGTQVNFKTDEAGEYTFTFSGAEIGYYLNDIKEQESALIKEGNAYVFTLEDGDDANRFYISRTPLGAPAIVTGIDEVDAEAMKVRKIIHNDQLYIIRCGQLYDATGKVVK